MRRSVFLLTLTACGGGGASDTFTGGSTSSQVIDVDQDGFAADLDCNDGDASVYPGAIEICDGQVNDCSGEGDETGIITVDGVNVAGLDDPSVPLASHIAICSGTHPGGLYFGADLTLEGFGEAVLQGPADAPNLTLVGGTFLVQGLTLEGGFGTNGGGISAGAAMELTLQDVVIDDAHAAYGGGLFSPMMATLTDVSIQNCTASEYGAGAYVPEGATVISDGLTVQDNVALLGGGFFVGSGSEWTATDTLLSGNTADFGGGAYLWSATTSGLQLNGNTAEMGGGAYVFEGGTLEAGTAQGNAASFGAGLAANQETLSLLDFHVSANTASIQGGGAYVDSANLIGDDLSSLTLNISEDLGGGAFLRDATAESLLITENVAVSGGGVYLSSSGLTASLSHLVVSQNTATDTGGGVLTLTDTVQITGSAFTDNHSDVRGGGLYASLGSVVHLDEICEIRGNSATFYGGGVYANTDAVITAQGLIVDANTAERGGGLYVNSGGSATLTGGYVTQNGDAASTISGGGVRVTVGSFSADLVDFGTGPTDNLVDDVYVGAGFISYTSYEAEATFYCDEYVCTPDA